MAEHFKAVTVGQVAEVLGVNVTSVRRRASNEGWQTEKIKRIRGGGHKHVFPLSTLPPEIQVALSRRNQNPDLQPAENLPPAGQGSCAVRPSSMAAQDRLPGWAEAIAHARADLVHHYIEARQNSKTKNSKATAAKQFLDAYNSGHAWPQLHATLGTVSRSTLERWRKDLEDNQFDCRALAPAWGKHRNGKAKITDREFNQLLDILLHQNRVKIGTAIRDTKTILKLKGIPSPASPATMRRAVEAFKQNSRHVWTCARKGEKALIDEALPFIRRDDSRLAVGDVLVADGKRCNFFVNHPFTGRRCRPILIGFFDWRSRVLCGWSLAAEETVQNISTALRRAIIVLGKTPGAVLLDNGKAFKSKIFTGDKDLTQAGLMGMYARLGIQVRFAWPYNARSKPIERFFCDFGNQFERYLPSFCGDSIKDKPASLMRNEKAMKKIYGETVMEIPQVMDAFQTWWQFHLMDPHPTMKGKQKGEVFAQGRGTGVDESELHFLMMDHAVKRIHQNGITFLGADYYDETLCGLNIQVVVRYDLNDISSILVYAQSGEFICRAKRKALVHPQATWMGDAKDVAELKYQIGLHKGLKKQTLKLTRQALEITGGLAPINALPMDRMIPAAPDLPEKIEAISAEHEGGEASRRARVIVIDEPYEPAPEPPPENVTPIFTTEIQYYDHLANKAELTVDEREWLDEFYASETGQKLKAMETPKTGTQGESQ